MSMLKFKLMANLLLMLTFSTQDGSRSEQEARRHKNTICVLVIVGFFPV